MGQDEELIESVYEVSKSIDDLRASNEEESRRRRSDTRRCAVDPDVLTEEEIEELRTLIAYDGELREYCRSRIEANGRRQRGLYGELGRLGLTVNEDAGAPYYLTSNAHWAVEKHDQRTAERKRESKRQFWREVLMALIGSVFGGLMGILGTAVGIWLERCYFA